MFFNHVELHKYDLTNKGISQACYDELTIQLADAKNALTEEQLWVLADDMREKFKDYMRCLLYTSPSPRDSDTSRMPSSA